MEDKIFNSWMAGFWEGEGSIFKKSEKRYRVYKDGQKGLQKRVRCRSYCISIGQSIDKNRTVNFLMEKIQKTFGGHLSYRDIKDYKSKIEWRLTKREDVIRFINAICPYCQIRKRDLENCLEYFETHPSLKWNKFVDLEKVKDLRIQGKTYKQIGEIFNVCAKTIFVKYRNHYSYKRQHFSRLKCGF